jgi:KDO2-lipid IV(A) lauroyltransferase
LGLALGLGRFFGLVWYYLIPVRRSVALANVRRSIGRDLPPREQRRVVRRSFQRLGMYLMEVLRLPILTPALSEELVEQQNFELIEAALARGKGLILVASHLDNVDLAGCSMSVRGLPMTVVAKQISWKPGAEFIVTVREATGITLIPTRRSKSMIRQLLGENKIVTLVIDQYVKPRHAIVCPFFDQPALTSHAPARFAAATMSRQHIVRIEEVPLEAPHEDEAANVRHNTCAINRIVEGWIREFPEQWLWPHRRWKD